VIMMLYYGGYEIDATWDDVYSIREAIDSGEMERII